MLKYGPQWLQVGAICINLGIAAQGQAGGQPPGYMATFGYMRHVEPYLKILAPVGRDEHNMDQLGWSGSWPISAQYKPKGGCPMELPMPGRPRGSPVSAGKLRAAPPWRSSVLGSVQREASKLRELRLNIQAQGPEGSRPECVRKSWCGNPPGSIGRNYTRKLTLISLGLWGKMWWPKGRFGKQPWMYEVHLLGSRPKYNCKQRQQKFCALVPDVVRK